MHHRIRTPDQPVHECRIADVAHHELHAVGGQASDVGGIAGVGKLVEHGHVHTGMLAHHPAHKVGPDKAATVILLDAKMRVK